MSALQTHRRGSEAHWCSRRHARGTDLGYIHGIKSLGTRPSNHIFLQALQVILTHSAHSSATRRACCALGWFSNWAGRVVNPHGRAKEARAMPRVTRRGQGGVWNLTLLPLSPGRSEAPHPPRSRWEALELRKPRSKGW